VAWKRAINCWISCSWARRICGGTCGAAAGLFFYADTQLSAGLLDDLLSVLLGQLLVFVITVDRLLDFRDLILRQIAAAVFAIFPRIETVVGAVGSLADNREGAVLHPLDLKDLFEKRLSRKR
jgi:hypothetical protein